ncbi:MAG: L,D-transpeptidase family protein [Deltaproteobacteria bacterium]|nr:L,D-transpeptidase family protein [Deltaproteobacteria bacterium]
MKRSASWVVFLVLGLVPAWSEAPAETYFLPRNSSDSVIGEVRYVEAAAEDTLLDVARRNSLGHDEIVQANPTIDRWVPGAGTKVLLPTRFVLPDAPMDGIVLNVAELRLYYYPPNKDPLQRVVMTFPVSIGRMDWKTPLGKTKVTRAVKNPPWTPPKSIREEHAAEGDYLPDVIPGGDPTNPLGLYALQLGIPGYLIHGTDERKSAGIGMHVTHGCVRMYPEDIEWLYRFVEPGTPVYLIDQPVKAGWQSGSLYLEIHTPLEGLPEFDARLPDQIFEESMQRLVALANGALRIDHDAVGRTVDVGNGVPTLAAAAEAALPPARTSSPEPTRRPPSRR